MKVGRNARCPCGSEKKFKNCCAKKGTAGKRDWSKAALVLVGIGLVVGAASMVSSAMSSDGPSEDGRVWSAEHGHWHDASGREIGAGSRSLPPPGPAPAGKVWSMEHGHWHDAE